MPVCTQATQYPQAEPKLGIMVARTYALYERKAWVAVLYLLVCLSVLGLAVVRLLPQ